jgi:transcriptional regulator with XRE-family HTH domain
MLVTRGTHWETTGVDSKPGGVALRDEMSNDQWPEYVRRIAPGMTQAQIASRIGVSASNVGRWIRGEPGQPAAENVIAFAKAFSRPPLEALTAAGYFTPSEVVPKFRSPLSEYSTSELFEELRKRTHD